MDADRITRRNRERIMLEWRGIEDDPNSSNGIRSASEFLEKILVLAGMSDGIEEEKLKSLWKEVAGGSIASCSVPDSFKRGVLSIRVTQPAMRFHLEQMRGTILSGLQQKLGSNKIKSIRFIHG